MPVDSYSVQTLFVEPYFRANIASAITPAQIAFVQSLPMINNIDNQISETMQLFEEPEMKSIKDAVQDVLDIYAREVMCIPQRLYVTQSWSLINMPNVGMHGHSHSNSVMSGSLYYCPLPDPPAKMIFTRHTAYSQIELPPDSRWALAVEGEAWFLALGGEGEFDAVSASPGAAVFIEGETIGLRAGPAGLKGLIAYAAGVPLPGLLRRCDDQATGDVPSRFPEPLELPT